MSKNIAAISLPRNPPKCVECGERAFLHQHEDTARWVCSCGAYAYCKQGSLLPGARPCGDETREARRAAHSACEASGIRRAESPSSRHLWEAINQGRFLAAKHFGTTYKSFQFGWMTKAEADAAKVFFEGLS